jgi:hypothetical protein
MSAVFGRVLMSGLTSNAGNIAGGAAGFYALNETMDVLTKNPMIPVAIASIILFVVLKKKNNII